MSSRCGQRAPNSKGVPLPCRALPLTLPLSVFPGPGWPELVTPPPHSQAMTASLFCLMPRPSGHRETKSPGETGRQAPSSRDTPEQKPSWKQFPGGLGFGDAPSPGSRRAAGWHPCRHPQQLASLRQCGSLLLEESQSRKRSSSSSSSSGSNRPGVLMPPGPSACRGTEPCSMTHCGRRKVPQGLSPQTRLRQQPALGARIVTTGLQAPQSLAAVLGTAHLLPLQAASMGGEVRGQREGGHREAGPQQGAGGEDGPA
nr:uncharacterized protein LOC116285412 [Vicugna pacos]